MYLSCSWVCERGNRLCYDFYVGMASIVDIVEMYEGIADHVDRAAKLLAK